MNVTNFLRSSRKTISPSAWDALDVLVALVLATFTFGNLHFDVLMIVRAIHVELSTMPQ